MFCTSIRIVTGFMDLHLVTSEAFTEVASSSFAIIASSVITTCFVAFVTNTSTTVTYTITALPIIEQQLVQQAVTVAASTVTTELMFDYYSTGQYSILFPFLN